MTTADRLARYTALHSGTDGLYETEVDALGLIRADRPSHPVHTVYEPTVCVVFQGAKQVTVGETVLEYGPGDHLVVGLDIPVVGRVTEASPEAPYLAVQVRLDLGLLAEVARDAGVTVDPTDEDGAALRAFVAPLGRPAAEALDRLVGLLDTPRAIPALYPAVARELYYWLLVGPGGDAFARATLPGGHAAQIAEAVRQMQEAFPGPIRVGDLAESAGMSESSFYNHFQSVTGMPPLQYYKRLRLLEARRLLAAEGASARGAAFAVGYESPSQFGREYKRLFGAPPIRDAARLRTRRERV